MKNKTNKKSGNSIIYIVCAIMLVATVAIGIVTGIGSGKSTSPVSLPDTDVCPVTEDSQPITEELPEDSSAPDTTSESVDDSSAPAESGESASVAAPVEFCLPVTGHLSKDYSMDIPVFSLTMNDYRTHSGIDIQAEAGSAVYAVAQGTVTDRYTDPFMGVCVELTHGGGLVSRYMNMDEDYPKDAEVGCKIYAGQTIGCIGNTASAEAMESEHLHFEMLRDGEHTDPLNYISYEYIEDEGYEE